jgi:hypothetical protein
MNQFAMRNLYGLLALGTEFIYVRTGTSHHCSRCSRTHRRCILCSFIVFLLRDVNRGVAEGAAAPSSGGADGPASMLGCSKDTLAVLGSDCLNNTMSAGAKIGHSAPLERSIAAE